MNRSTIFHVMNRSLLLTILLTPWAIIAQAAEREVQPVLMVISNQDFYYQEYHEMRKSLEARGLEVVVAATTTKPAQPQDRDDGTQVVPDAALEDVVADDHSGIVFIGGWGSSSYQYANEVIYVNPAYQPGEGAFEANRLINEFVKANKPVAAICHGVTVLAWARVDGVSPLKGRTVVASAGGLPSFRQRRTIYPDAEVPVRWDIERNGALMLTSGSVGDPLSSHDDVYVDGNIITAESLEAADRSSAYIQLAAMTH